MAREERCKHPNSTDVDEAQALRMITQYFISIDNGPTRAQRTQQSNDPWFLNIAGGHFDRTVGGYLTEIVTTPSGFWYAPHTHLTLPDRMSYHLKQAECGRMHLVARTDTPVVHQRYTLVGGRPSDRGAIGFCLPEGKSGIFYPMENRGTRQYFDRVVGRRNGSDRVD
jgi:hypothetical protein